MPGETKAFNELLTEAINDLVENGFDSMERVERWTRALRAAAERAATSEAEMQRLLDDALRSIYKTFADGTAAVRVAPDVARYRLEQIKPKLRAELDRRIMASANLIKLNREQAIEKTIQRFQGWATSIPPGGTDAAERGKTKKNVRKSLAQLPFEERRVLIDQGHKLRATLSDIVAVDGGAIAMKWRSNWRQPGYNYRTDHKERDGQIYLLRESWARDQGLVKPGKAGFYDDVTKVGEEVFCRCYAVWIYALRDLPADMLTKKGQTALAQARARIAEMA